MKNVRKSIGIFLCIAMLLLFKVWAQPEIICPMFGDANLNNNIAAEDALRTLQISVLDQNYELNPALPTAADTRNTMPTLYLLDVNGDYKITAADALLILQYSVNKINSFPVESKGGYDMYFKEDYDKWATQVVEINETNFPDDVFRAIVQGFDSDRNGWLSESEIAWVTAIKINYKYTDDEIALIPHDLLYLYGEKIDNLKGIEYFTALKVLDCSGNRLTELDVSHNTALTSLDCSSNYLNALDIGKNIALTSLNCKNNYLATLDVSQNTQLTLLNCGSNRLSVLDVSQNTALEQLKCASNKLSELDVTKNNSLTLLGCDKDVTVTDWEFPVDVAEINATNFPDAVFKNDVQKFDLNEDGWLSEDEIAIVTEIKVSTAVDVIQVMPPPPVRPKINTLKGIEYFTVLEGLDCTGNDLTELDVSHNTALISLACGGNPLGTLDVSNNMALTSLYCYDNDLDTLDISQNTKLAVLNCSYNNLNTLDISRNIALTGLDCSNNPLGTLDISYNTALKNLNCSSNNLNILDISQNTALTGLNCYSNKLTTLNLSNNIALTDLSCQDNELSALDTKQNIVLKWLYCKNNRLTELDVTYNTALKYISCDENVNTIGWPK